MITIKDRYEQVIRIMERTEKFDPCNSNTNTLIKLVYDMAEEIEKLQEEIDAWRDCIMIDALMSGPRFKGFNRSAGQRVFDKYIGKK